MTISQEEKKEQALNMESVTWGDLTWLNVEQPTKRETEYLAQNYHFNLMDLDDCLSRIQRPKLDVYKGYLFLIFHYTVWDKVRRIGTHEQVSVFVGDKFLITLHSGRYKTLVNLFKKCQSDEEARRESFSYGSGYLLYRILDRAVDSYFPILDKILSLVDDVEDSVFDESVEAAQEIFMLRRDVITQRRIMLPNRTVFTELEPELRRFSAVDMETYFGDLIDHMNKICEMLDECKEIIEAFKDTDYVLNTDRLNRIVRALTIMSTIFLPFLIISSLFGMNVFLPGGTENGGLQSFLLLLASMGVVAGGMLYVFHRKRWI